jgi:hypothetical protein
MLLSDNPQKRLYALDALSQQTSNSWSKSVRTWVEQLSTDPSQPADIRVKALNMLEPAQTCHSQCSKVHKRRVMPRSHQLQFHRLAGSDAHNHRCHPKQCCGP